MSIQSIILDDLKISMSVINDYFVKQIFESNYQVNHITDTYADITVGDYHFCIWYYHDKVNTWGPGDNDFKLNFRDDVKASISDNFRKKYKEVLKLKKLEEIRKLKSQLAKLKGNENS